ncbi:hypothetical protein GLYMA_04G199100v4 [Glycine max]|uniref:Uncharacterized protein n=2 Tax=Glycine max TaxID=3847 RepID=A0A0R0KGX5_SOYBN|nr:hypothetical protein GYH30_010518 [Glycine max]KRH63819.1 hypothetical protein GLYMA_04G199100v4 [Glycine max]|eukprot:XP_006579321.2 nucleolin [Glycine max]
MHTITIYNPFIILHLLPTLHCVIIIILIKMGGNNSRLNGNGGEVLPARIRNRWEELRKRKSGEDGTLLKKELLNSDGVDEGNSQSSEENGSEHKRDSLNDAQQAKGVEKLSKVVPLPVSEPGNEEQRNELHNEEKGKDAEKKGEVVELKTGKVQSTAGLQPEIKHEESNVKNDSSDDDDEDEDEDEDEEDDIQRLIGPSSPSFKIYCTEADKIKEEELHDSKALGDENQTVALLQKSSSTNSIDESSTSASGNTGNSNEIVEIKSASSKRKGNKKKKFGAMKKNLLQVKHLNMNRMNPILACTGNDRRRLLSED